MILIKQTIRLHWKVVLGIATIFAVMLTIGLSWILYNHTVNLLTDNLRKRLLSIAITGAVQFDADDIQALHTEEDWKKPEWKTVVNQMKNIRTNNENVVYVYMFRKSDNDPAKMIFVADSHSIHPYANDDADPTNDIDLNGDGIIDEADQLQWPGQAYPEPPEEVFEAYEGPMTNRELYEDQWGQFFTGYAPIRDEDGHVVAILAIDVRANDFFTITNQTLFPFLIFIAFLCVLALSSFGGFMYMMSDRVTHMKAVDQKKDELIDLVSHELVTPITAAKLTIESMQSRMSGLVSPEHAKDLHTVYTTLESLSEFVRNILDTSRLELGRMQVHLTRLSLVTFFRDLIQSVEPLAKRKDIHLDVDIPKYMPDIFLDHNLARITVKNLLDNAMKYTPKGGHVQLVVELSDAMLRYEVHDTGCGIPLDQQDQIFGKLFRASNVEAMEGNGFGLYAAKGAVESLNGTIRFESTEGEGTVFFVEIPFEAVPEAR